MIIADKYEGESMVQMLNRVRAEYGISSTEKMTFAGRLDPLASGQCIVLTGDECKEKETYTNLSKEYEVTFLEGFETDTLDPLGIIQNIKNVKANNLKKVDQEVLENMLVGTHKLAYPMYSSKTVDGKPLWLCAREGLETKAPAREMNITSVEFLHEEFCDSQQVVMEIIERIKTVDGDFRQQEIIKKYHEIFEHKNFTTRRITVRIICGSGSYMRSLTQLLTKYTQTPWIAERIHRTQIFM